MAKNKIKKRPEFTRAPEGFSKIFRISSSKKIEDKVIEKEIMNGEFVDNDGRKKQISVIYIGLQQDAYALLLFLILLAKINVKKNSKELEIIKATDNRNTDIVKKLHYIIEPPDENDENSDLTNLLKVETNYKELILWLGLSYGSKNIKRIEKIIEKLQISSIKIIVKDMEDHSVKKVYSNLFLWQSIVYKNRNQNKISIVFNPIAYLVLFSDINFKSTVNLNIAMELSKKNVNKVVLFYAICDHLKFNNERKFPLYTLFSLWTQPAKSRQTESFRRKFIIETLKEIEELSGGSFKFKIDENYTITATRIPDREKLDKP
jgi:hypothetical protein